MLPTQSRLKVFKESIRWSRYLFLATAWFWVQTNLASAQINVPPGFSVQVLASGFTPSPPPSGSGVGTLQDIEPGQGGGFGTDLYYIVFPDKIYRISPTGGTPVLFATIPGVQLTMLRFGFGGDLFAVTGNGGPGNIYRITPGGVVSWFSVVPTSVEGIAYSSGGPFGNRLFVSEFDRRIVTSIDSVGSTSFFANVGVRTTGLQFASGGSFGSNLFVMDQPGTIFVLDPVGTSSLFSGINFDPLINFAETLAFGSASTLFGDNLFVAEQRVSPGEILQISPSGTITTFASGFVGFDLGGVTGLEFSHDGTTLFVTDDGAGVIYAITGPFVNTAPMVNAGPDAVSSEGSTFSQTGSFTDLDNGAWTATVNYGDGSPTQSLALNLNKTFTLSHVYQDNGTYIVTVTVEDDLEASGHDQVTVTVNNANPQVATLSLSSASILETGSGTLSGTITDPGTLDNHTVTINWGDGSTNTTIHLSAGALQFSSAHVYLDDNPTGTSSDVAQITVTVVDKDLGSGNAQTPITINNVAPVITSVTGPTVPQMINSTATLTAHFTDAGGQDTHICTFFWDDGQPNTTATGSSGSCSSTRMYAAAGVYTVQVTVTDDDTGSATSIFQFVVIYDPDGNFVTGGGWINSPAGAYTSNPNLTGKANFGLVSKYQKGATIPTGQTQFDFNVANFRFHASVYEWLVVAGAKAQYKGTGSINGVGSYKFLLTLTDGDRPGGGGVDKFRIKITDPTTGAVIYDNVLGSPDDPDAANPQAIAGGSIVIHN